MGVKFLWQFDDQIAAYHEAGHAVMASLLGCKVESVTLTTTQVWQSEDDHLAGGRIALAGPLAECLKRGIDDQGYNRANVDRWTHEDLIARQEFGLCGAEYDQQYQWIKAQLIENWPKVERLALDLTGGQ